MNVGIMATDVTVTNTLGFSGAPRVETRNILAETSETFSLVAFPDGETFVGSARVAGNSAN
jgi:hypothetical protein